MAGIRNAGASGGVSEVDSNNNFNVNLPKVNSQAGLLGVGGIVHDGSSGSSRMIRSIDESYNRRLKSGSDTLLFYETFEYSSQNTAKWWQATSGGALIGYGTNSDADLNSTYVTGAISAQMSTYRLFPQYEIGLILEIYANLPYATDATTVVE